MEHTLTTIADLSYQLLRQGMTQPPKPVSLNANLVQIICESAELQFNDISDWAKEPYATALFQLFYVAGLKISSQHRMADSNFLDNRLQLMCLTLVGASQTPSLTTGMPEDAQLPLSPAKVLSSLKLLVNNLTNKGYCILQK